jgi:hypothetical protein
MAGYEHDEVPLSPDGEDVLAAIARTGGRFGSETRENLQTDGWSSVHIRTALSELQQGNLLDPTLAMTATGEDLQGRLAERSKVRKLRDEVSWRARNGGARGWDPSVFLEGDVPVQPEPGPGEADALTGHAPPDQERSLGDNELAFLKHMLGRGLFNAQSQLEFARAKWATSQVEDVAATLRERGIVRNATPDEFEQQVAVYVFTPDGYRQAQRIVMEATGEFHGRPLPDPDRTQVITGQRTDRAPAGNVTATSEPSPAEARPAFSPVVVTMIAKQVNGGKIEPAKLIERVLAAPEASVAWLTGNQPQGNRDAVAEALNANYDEFVGAAISAIDANPGDMPHLERLLEIADTGFRLGGQGQQPPGL